MISREEEMRPGKVLENGWISQSTSYAYVEMAESRGPPATMWCGQVEDTQRPSYNSMICPQPEPLQYTSVWWTEGREREAEQLEPSEERWHWRRKGGEEQHVVSSLSAMVMSWPMLLLRAMSGFMAM